MVRSMIIAKYHVWFDRGKLQNLTPSAHRCGGTASVGNSHCCYTDVESSKPGKWKSGREHILRVVVDEAQKVAVAGSLSPLHVVMLTVDLAYLAYNCAKLKHKPALQ